MCFVLSKVAVERKVVLELISLTPEGFHDHVILSLHYNKDYTVRHQRLLFVRQKNPVDM